MTLQGLKSLIGLDLVSDDPFHGAQDLQVVIFSTWLLLSDTHLRTFGQLVSNQ